MTSLLPISKSYVATWKKCPWKAWAHKMLGMPSVSGAAAQNGIRLHALWATAIQKSTWEEAAAAIKDAAEADIQFIREAWNKHPDLRPGVEQVVEEHFVLNRGGHS